MKKSSKYSGVVVPMVTPLTGTFSLDHAALEKIFSSFYINDVMPFILGTTGESASLSHAMKKEYITMAGKLKATGTILYAGISSNCVDESLELAHHCFDVGIDVVIATVPSYYLLSEDEMKKYFELLADRAAGPVMIYNIPSTTHISIPLHIIDELSHHENIVGIKDSERSEERLKGSLQLWSGREDFSHFTGWAAKSADALMNGTDGLIPGSGNLYPQLYQKLYKAVRDSEKEKAFELQNLSDTIGDIYQKGRSLAASLSALKVLMEEAGLCESYVMPPLQPLCAEEEISLRREWQVMSKREIIQL